MLWSYYKILYFEDVFKSVNNFNYVKYFSKLKPRSTSREVVLTADIFSSETEDIFGKSKFYQDILKQYSENEYYDSDGDFLFQ